MSEPGVPHRAVALRSALNRLRRPIVVCDENQRLEPLNAHATALFEAENLRGDMLSARPSHPLSQLIADILRTDAPEKTAGRTFTFPSGRRYVVEASARSEKGMQRWLILLFEPLAEIPLDEDAVLAQWPLTERERDVAKLIVRGLSNEAIAREMGVSPETVKTHVHSIFEKSKTHRRAEFLSIVLRSR